MPHSYNNGDSGSSIRTKINGIFGVESGALADPYELTFDIYQRYRTLTVSADIELALAASGKVSQSFETLTTTGDGVHSLTFPTEWIMLGDPFDFDKVQEIAFRWTGTYVIGVITTLADLSTTPTLTGAVIENATANRLDLTFSQAVDITTSGWTVTASGGAVTVDSVASGDGTTTPKFTLSRSIAMGETVTVSYDDGTGATVGTDGGLELADITNSAVTNNVVTINFSDTFTGASIDTAKWDVTNPDSANLTISQNNKLIFKRTTDVAVASSVTNFVRSDNTYGRGVYACLMNRDTGFINSAAVFQYRVDADNDISILQTGSSGIVLIRVRQATTTVYTLTTAISSSNRFRIRYASNHDIIFEYLNAGTWTQMGTTQNYNIGAAGNIQMCTNSNASDAANDQFSFDDVYVTEGTYTGSTP